MSYFFNDLAALRRLGELAVKGVDLSAVKLLSVAGCLDTHSLLGIPLPCAKFLKLHYLASRGKSRGLERLLLNDELKFVG
jgi:hypothetical protein